MNMRHSEIVAFDASMISRPTAAPTAPGFVSRLRQVFARVAELPRRQAVLNELQQLSDRELADIGLQRQDIHRVFDRNFAATRAAA